MLEEGGLSIGFRLHVGARSSGRRAVAKPESPFFLTRRGMGLGPLSRPFASKLAPTGTGVL